MVPTGNPAYALRNVLQAVMGSGAQTVLQSWETVLQAKAGSSDFARRHSEAVGLFSRVCERLLALPPDVEGRDQYVEYIPDWYAAVVYRAQWNNTNHPPSGLGDPQTISQLTGLGAMFELHSLTISGVTDDAISRLRESLKDWDSILDDAAIDERLRNEIRASVDRLRFLLQDDVLATFGTEPVIKASRDLSGVGVSAMVRTKSSVAKRIGAAVGVILVALSQLHKAVDDVNGLFEGTIKMCEQVSELIHPTKEIEAPSNPEELTERSTSEENQADIVDVETVDDDPAHPRAEG